MIHRPSNVKLMNVCEILKCTVIRKTWQHTEINGLAVQETHNWQYADIHTS